MPQGLTKSPLPPCQAEIQRWDWPGAVQCTHSSRTKEHRLNLEQGKTSPHEVINPAQPERAPYLLTRKCSRLKAHSHMAKQGWKDGMHKMAFPSRWDQVHMMGGWQGQNLNLGFPGTKAHEPSHA